MSEKILLLSLLIVLSTCIYISRTRARISTFDNTLYDTETKTLDDIFKPHFTFISSLTDEGYQVDNTLTDNVRGALKGYVQQKLTDIFKNTQFEDSKVIRDIYNIRVERPGSLLARFSFNVDITNRTLAFTRPLRIHVEMKDYDEMLASVTGMLPDIRLLSISTVAQTEKFTYEHVTTFQSEPVVIKNRYNYI